MAPSSSRTDGSKRKFSSALGCVSDLMYDVTLSNKGEEGRSSRGG